MKRKDFALVVKRYAHLWHSYDPIGLKEKLVQYTALALSLNEGIFEKDSIQRDDFIRFTSQLPQLVDAIYLMTLDIGGSGNKKKEFVKTTKLGSKQIKRPMLYVWDFFQIFPMKFIEIELGLWLDGLISKELKMSNPLEKNDVFAFFLFLHEFIEVSYLMFRYLKGLQKEDEKEKKKA